MSRIERFLWAALVAVNVATHFVALEERSTGHDESMHAFYSYELAKKGEYRHDPMMHGPFLFHSTAAVFLVFGDSDATARLYPALSGILLIPALWLYRRYLGRAGALLAGALVTVSPSILFYGRYLRNDTPMALFALVWAYGALRYLDTRRTFHLLLMAGAFSVSICTKETVFLTGVTFGAFFAVLGLWRVVRGRERLRESPAGHVALLLATLVLPFLTSLVHVAKGWNPADFETAESHARAMALLPAALALSAAIAFAWCFRSGPRGLGFRTWLKAAAVFWTLPIVLFTTFFTNFQRGLTSGIVGSVGYWLGQHDVARGSQPWFYYAMLAMVYEPLALLAALAGGAWLLRRSGRAPAPFVALLAWWCLASFVLYSWAGEKMPWLLVHVTLPLCLLGGSMLSRLWAAAAWGTVPRLRGWALLAFPLLLIGVVAPLAWLQPTGRSLDAAAAAARISTHLLALSGLAYVGWRLARPLRRGQAAALLGLGLAAVLGAHTLRSALRLTFVNADLASELLFYAHGTPDLKRALREVDEVAERTGQGERLEVAYDDDSTWPINWYLRHYTRQRYLGDSPAPPALLAPVVMIGSKNIGMAQPHLEQDYVRRDYRLIWWPAEDYMRSGPADLWRALRDPQRRRWIVRYLLERETGYDFTEWPLRHEFKLFVRKDLATQAWPLGFEALRSTGPAAPATPHVPCVPVSVAEGPFAGRLLEAPESIAVGAGGTRIVADTGAHRIVVLDRDDRFVRAFGSRCETSKGAEGGCLDPDGDGPRAVGDGQLLEPWGVAAGPDGATLVADTWNGRVVFFDAAGRFVRSWGSLSVGTQPPVAPELMYGPRGIAYDATRKLVAVSDTGHKRILVFGLDGSLKAEHGGPGKEVGRFDEPVGLAFGPDGSLYVADAWNQRIQRFDASLQSTGVWAVPAWGSRAIADKPYLAVAKSGVVFASDPGSARVLVYSPEGALTATLAVPEWGREPRTRPTGLALDEARGRLLVTDPARNRVWSLSVGANADQLCRQP